VCSCGSVFNSGDNIYSLNRCIKLKSRPGDMNPKSDYYIWVVLSETAAYAVIEWFIELRLDPQNKSFLRRSLKKLMLWNHRYWPLKSCDVLPVCSQLLLVIVASFHRGWLGWVDPDSWLRAMCLSVPVLSIPDIEWLPDSRESCNHWARMLHAGITELKMPRAAVANWSINCWFVASTPAVFFLWRIYCSWWRTLRAASAA